MYIHTLITTYNARYDLRFVSAYQMSEVITINVNYPIDLHI